VENSGEPFTRREILPASAVTITRGVFQSGWPVVVFKVV